jgi:hypothetical protein
MATGPTPWQKKGDGIGYSGHKHQKGKKVLAIIDNHGYVLALVPVAPVNETDNAGMIPNIKENPRNRKATKRGRKRLFNAAIHALRMCVEQTFAWEDKFKRLLLRFERIQQR